jgi:uncharacterized protein YjiS (DUF1127 family)
METTMLVTAMIHFAPRSIADARTARAKYVGKIARIGFRRLVRRITLFRKRIALARQYDEDMTMLLQADDRMLLDIGVTRSEVIAAASDDRWFRPNRMLAAAAQRRKDAMGTAEVCHALPRTAAPALTPGAPAQFLAVETSNFR